MPSRPNAMNALFRPLSNLVVASVLIVASAAHAQSAAPDAEKQKLIDRLLVLFHPETRVLQLVQQQGLNAMQQSAIALSTAHVPQDRKDKTLAEIHDDVQKYIDTTMPVAVASARKFTGPAVSPLLLQDFSVEELRQLVAFYESPVKAKFEKLVPQFESAVGQKVQADIAPTVDKNVKTMTEAIGTKLRVAATLQ
jgi:hypothetical protein